MSEQVAEHDVTAELELVERAKQREPHAWAEIYERFSGSVYAFFVHQLQNRQTAEDLTGGVFVEGLQSAHRFQGDLAAMRSWLFRIARNNLIDYFRRERRVTWEPIDDTNPTELARVSPVEDPEESALSNLDRQRLLEVIESLSPDQREVVLLRLAGGLTSPEIAEMVGKTVGAVKALQHRAVASLARALQPADRRGGV
ncbi:MAG: sigma-70 family RNA polymerase sigma factor [Actinomycetota bacterium]